MRAQYFLHLHCQQVAVEHRGGLHHHFAHRKHRYLDGIAAGLPDAALHRLRPLAQMRVAGADLAPGVENANDRLAQKLLAPKPHLLRALAVREATHVGSRVPALAAKAVHGAPLTAHPFMPPAVSPETTRSWKMTMRMASGTMPTTRAAEITVQGKANSP